MKLARIPEDEAAEAIPWLLSQDLVDKGAKIEKEDGDVLVPILEDGIAAVSSRGWDVVDGFTHVRDSRSPQRKVLDAIDIPDDLLESLPMRWEWVGDIIILKGLDPRLWPYSQHIGKVYAQAVGAATVCVDRGGVRGELRQPDVAVIHGSVTESMRRENGIDYLFDVTKVMFASGNVDERERMKNLDCSGETVVDMFAGIGYFTLPLAKFANPDRVLACEKNPDSHHYLRRNLELNDVEDRVEAILGDNRDLSEDISADRILMGYVHGTAGFLPKALSMLRPGGIIHFHENYHVRTVRDELEKDIRCWCGDRRYDLLNLREVKSYAPSVSHYVADIRFY